MKKLFLLILFYSVLLSGCAGKKHDSYFSKPVYEPKYAKGFCIFGSDSLKSTIIRVKNPWQGTENVEMDYFISRNGENPPSNFKGQIIKAGARRIVCMSSSYIAMFDAIGQTDRIVGVSGINYITNKYIQDNRDKIKDVGAEINYETVAMLNPDVVLLYGIGDARTAETDKMKELSIPYMYVGEYLEESPLGRAEWLVALSELTDSRVDGINAFNKIPERYENMKSLVEGISYRPLVMLNTPWADSWVLPPVNSYMPTLIYDAGGKYIYDKNKSKSSVPVGIETAYSLVSKADFWLNLSSISSIDEVLNINPKFSETKVVREKRIYNNNNRVSKYGANDFWESSVVKPDIVLRDLIKIFHPEIVSDTLYYYRRLE